MTADVSQTREPVATKSHSDHETEGVPGHGMRFCVTCGTRYLAQRIQ